MLTSDIAKITKTLKNTHSAAVYIYGSQVKGKTHKQSDIDLAILSTNPQKYNHRYFSKKLLHLPTSQPLDIRIISTEQDPTYLSQIIRFGKPIVINHPAIKTQFEITAMKKYYDIQPYQKLKQQKIANYART